VAEKPLAWTAFSESSSWTGVWCKTREGAQERVDEFKRRWPKTGPYRVVPLYAQPARATAERGGDVRLFMRACQVLGCGARGVTENAGPWYCAIHHPEHPATPASAAGREGAVATSAVAQPWPLVDLKALAAMVHPASIHVRPNDFLPPRTMIVSPDLAEAFKAAFPQAEAEGGDR
jgi:hypothetical protein